MLTITGDPGSGEVVMMIHVIVMMVRRIDRRKQNSARVFVEDAKDEDDCLIPGSGLL